MKRKIVTFSYSREDLVKRLGLPKGSVIIRIYESTTSIFPEHNLERKFCVDISVSEKVLRRFFGFKEKVSE